MKLSPSSLNWMRNRLLDAIQHLYDDPTAVIDVAKNHQRLVEVAADLNVDFDEAVGNVATSYERERMAHLLGGPPHADTPVNELTLRQAAENLAWVWDHIDDEEDVHEELGAAVLGVVHAVHDHY